MVLLTALSRLLSSVPELDIGDLRFLEPEEDDVGDALQSPLRRRPSFSCILTNANHNNSNNNAVPDNNNDDNAVINVRARLLEVPDAVKELTLLQRLGLCERRGLVGWAAEGEDDSDGNGSIWLVFRDADADSVDYPLHHVVSESSSCCPFPPLFRSLCRDLVAFVAQKRCVGLLAPSCVRYSNVWVRLRCTTAPNDSDEGEFFLRDLDADGQFNGDDAYNNGTQSQNKSALLWRALFQLLSTAWDDGVKLSAANKCKPATTDTSDDSSVRTVEDFFFVFEAALSNCEQSRARFESDDMTSLNNNNNNNNNNN
eukprot:PhM_4_TR14807/c1_g1_i1/m.89309